MPIYEYRCNDCDEHFERLFQSPNDIPSDITCPACGGSDVQRLISPPAAIHTGGESESVEEEAEDTSDQTQLFGRKELNGLGKS